MAGHEAHSGHDMGKMADAAPAAVFDPASASVSLSVTGPDGAAARAGEEARIEVTVTDRATGAPVSGLEMAGWMLLRRNAQVAAEMPCDAKARLFTQGRVTQRPDVDLNAARLLVLARSGMVAVVNPQVDFTITQMEGVIPLPGVPADWALSEDGSSLFVSLPVAADVAVIDTRGFRMSNLIELPKGSVPTTLLPLPGGALAVVLSARGTLTIARPDGSGPTAPVGIGAGPTALAEAAGILYAASADGKVTAIDATTGQVRASAALPAGEPSLSVAKDGSALYVASRTAAGIQILDARTLASRGTIEAAPGVTAFALTPKGSHLIALDGDTSRMLLADLKEGRVVDEARVADAPVEIAVSHDYAYVRGLEGDHFTVVELADLERGTISPVEVQSASSPVVRREALAKARLVAPYGHGALVSNPDERVAYYYMEGMNTPMGTVPLPAPDVQGTMTVDRGLRETAPGVYTTSATLPFAGTYDVPLVLGNARHTTCLVATAEPGAPAPSDNVASPVILSLAPDDVAPGPESIVIRIADTGTGAPMDGLTDVVVLAYNVGANWQARSRARDLGDGRYEARWDFPRAGQYRLSVASALAGLGFADHDPLDLRVRSASSLKESRP